MKKILLSIALLGLSMILAGCTQKTPVQNQNVNQIEVRCQNFPPPTFCPEGINDVIQIGTDDNGCGIYDCKSKTIK